MLLTKKLLNERRHADAHYWATQAASSGNEHGKFLAAMVAHRHCMRLADVSCDENQRALWIAYRDAATHAVESQAAWQEEAVDAFLTSFASLGITDYDSEARERFPYAETFAVDGSAYAAYLVGNELNPCTGYDGVRKDAARAERHLATAYCSESDVVPSSAPGYVSGSIRQLGLGAKGHQYNSNCEGIERPFDERWIDELISWNAARKRSLEEASNSTTSSYTPSKLLCDEYAAIAGGH